MIDLKALASLFDDDLLVRKYLDRFAQDIPPVIRQMNVALGEQDLHTLGLHAHTLKSQFLYINDHHAISLAIDIEQECQKTPRNESLIHDKLRALSLYVDHLLEEIKQING